MGNPEKVPTKKVMPVSPGRPKGVPNKNTTILKEAILRAATIAGQKIDPKGPDGLVTYLVEQAAANPAPFLTLLGKVLPMQVTGENGGEIAVVTRIERVIRGPVA